MIKLIASDMDGTLLDSQKRLPPGFYDAVRALKAQGTLFAVASGRQYAALRRDFDALADDILFICENGALVMQHEKQLLIDPIDPADLAHVIRLGRTIEGVYPVLCRADVALIEDSSDPAFKQEVERYYPSCRIVDDLLEYCDAPDVCKIAYFDPVDAQSYELPVFERGLKEGLCVILSGKNWVDVMKTGVHKGGAMKGLQDMLHIPPEACMAFGDYLNDYELLEAVGESYAMENGHPRLKNIARHIAPSNDEYGVMQVLKERFIL